MKVFEFMVQFRSFRDVLDFSAISSKQTLHLTVGNDRYQVNATSFMGIFALNCRKPLRVNVSCTQEEFDALLVTYDRFLVK